MRKASDATIVQTFHQPPFCRTFASEEIEEEIEKEHWKDFKGGIKWERPGRTPKKSLLPSSSSSSQQGQGAGSSIIINSSSPSTSSTSSTSSKSQQVQSSSPHPNINNRPSPSSSHHSHHQPQPSTNHHASSSHSFPIYPPFPPHSSPSPDPTESHHQVVPSVLACLPQNPGCFFFFDSHSHSFFRIDHGYVSRLTRPSHVIGAFGAFSVSGMAFFAPQNCLLFCDPSSHLIRSVSLNKDDYGSLSTFAGKSSSNKSIEGYKNGKLLKSLFSFPFDVTVSPWDDVIISDSGNHLIRMAKDEKMVDLAGRAKKRGYKDGPKRDCLFDRPLGVACNAHGEVFVCDNGNRRIRMIEATVEGVVKTVAGSGEDGLSDGDHLTAQLGNPMRIKITARGDLICLSHNLRMIQERGGVSTLWQVSKPYTYTTETISHLSRKKKSASRRFKDVLGMKLKPQSRVAVVNASLENQTVANHPSSSANKKDTSSFANVSSSPSTSVLTGPSSSTHPHPTPTPASKESSKPRHPSCSAPFPSPQHAPTFPSAKTSSSSHRDPSPSNHPSSSFSTFISRSSSSSFKDFYGDHSSDEDADELEWHPSDADKPREICDFFIDANGDLFYTDLGSHFNFLHMYGNFRPEATTTSDVDPLPQNASHHPHPPPQLSSLTMTLPPPSSGHSAAPSSLTSPLATLSHPSTTSSKPPLSKSSSNPLLPPPSASASASSWVPAVHLPSSPASSTRSSLAYQNKPDHSSSWASTRKDCSPPPPPGSEPSSSLSSSSLQNVPSLPTSASKKQHTDRSATVMRPSLGSHSSKLATSLSNVHQGRRGSSTTRLQTKPQPSRDNPSSPSSSSPSLGSKQTASFFDSSLSAAISSHPASSDYECAKIKVIKGANALIYPLKREAEDRRRHRDVSEPHCWGPLGDSVVPSLIVPSGDNVEVTPIHHPRLTSSSSVSHINTSSSSHPTIASSYRHTTSSARLNASSVLIPRDPSKGDDFDLSILLASDNPLSDYNLTFPVAEGGTKTWKLHSVVVFLACPSLLTMRTVLSIERSIFPSNVINALIQYIYGGTLPSTRRQGPLFWTHFAILSHLVTLHLVRQYACLRLYQSLVLHNSLELALKCIGEAGDAKFIFETVCDFLAHLLPYSLTQCPSKLSSLLMDTIKKENLYNLKEEAKKSKLEAPPVLAPLHHPISGLPMALDSSNTYHPSNAGTPNMVNYGRPHDTVVLKINAAVPNLIESSLSDPFVIAHRTSMLSYRFQGDSPLRKWNKVDPFGVTQEEVVTLGSWLNTAPSSPPTSSSSSSSKKLAPSLIPFPHIIHPNWYLKTHKNFVPCHSCILYARWPWFRSEIDKLIPSSSSSYGPNTSSSGSKSSSSSDPNPSSCGSKSSSLHPNPSSSTKSSPLAATSSSNLPLPSQFAPPESTQVPPQSGQSSLPSSIDRSVLSPPLFTPCIMTHDIRLFNDTLSTSMTRIKHGKKSKGKVSSAPSAATSTSRPNSPSDSPHSGSFNNMSLSLMYGSKLGLQVADSLHLNPSFSTSKDYKHRHSISLPNDTDLTYAYVQGLIWFLYSGDVSSVPKTSHLSTKLLASLGLAMENSKEMEDRRNHITAKSEERRRERFERRRQLSSVNWTDSTSEYESSTQSCYETTPGTIFDPLRERNSEMLERPLTVDNVIPSLNFARKHAHNGRYNDCLDFLRNNIGEIICRKDLKAEFESLPEQEYENILRSTNVSLPFISNNTSENKRQLAANNMAIEKLTREEVKSRKYSEILEKECSRIPATAERNVVPAPSLFSINYSPPGTPSFDNATHPSGGTLSSSRHGTLSSSLPHSPLPSSLPVSFLPLTSSLGRDSATLQGSKDLTVLSSLRSSSSDTSDSFNDNLPQLQKHDLSRTTELHQSPVEVEKRHTHSTGAVHRSTPSPEADSSNVSTHPKSLNSSLPMRQSHPLFVDGVYEFSRSPVRRSKSSA